MTTKFIYYLGMSINLIFIIFYLVIFELLIRANEFDGLIALTVVGTIWIIQFMLLNRRSIYIIVDTELKKVTFGNLFFKNECVYDQVNSIKASWIPSVYWINIGTAKYNFVATKLNLTELRTELNIN